MIKTITICERMKGSPHLFILGAGATKATIPDGDKYGRQSPVMENFLQELGLDYLLKNVVLNTKSKNIETIYSKLVHNPNNLPIVEKIEQGIINHYKNMEIPDEPTLYDYLLLSLRSKDCVATFNWDPLLIQAYNRVNKITSDLPHMLFLHGCVAVGVCDNCRQANPLRNEVCAYCGKPLIMPQLLYPVKHKNYSQNEYIKSSWDIFLKYLRESYIVTIWGYSAPKSDKEAKKMMRKAFSSKFRKLDQIEIINIDSEENIYKTWKPFIKTTNYHINIHKSLFDSYVGEFPRRSIEGYIKRNIEGWWGGSTLCMNDCKSFVELRDLYEPLLRNETENDYDVI